MEKSKTGYAENDDTIESKRNPMKLTRWEMETTINYNLEEKTAVLYTRDKCVMRKLDKLIERCPEHYKCIKETEIDKTYTFPKKLLGFRVPRVLTEEQRAEAAKRFAEAKARKQQETSVDEDDFDKEEDHEDLFDALDEE